MQPSRMCDKIWNVKSVLYVATIAEFQGLVADACVGFKIEMLFLKIESGSWWNSRLCSTCRVHLKIWVPSDYGVSKIWSEFVSRGHTTVWKRVEENFDGCKCSFPGCFSYLFCEWGQGEMIFFFLLSKETHLFQKSASAIFKNVLILKKWYYSACIS